MLDAAAVLPPMPFELVISEMEYAGRLAAPPAMFPVAFVGAAFGSIGEAEM